MDFQEFLESLDYNEGKISQGGQRLLPMPQLFIGGLQRALEEVLGENAAYAVAMSTMSDGAKTSAQGFNQILGDIPAEDKVRAFWSVTIQRGWGDAKITELTIEPFLMKMQVKNSYLKGVGKKMNSYYYYSAVSILEELVKAAGVEGVELEVEQTKWESAGDDFDEYVFKEA
ncbi:MAG: hypothetical protein KGY80_02345 [Candidatus Thorarchaeota archaeon]|nr:hypothetical protein [Candidatus Thorarchaeota archaeon]